LLRHMHMYIVQMLIRICLILCLIIPPTKLWVYWIHLACLFISLLVDINCPENILNTIEKISLKLFEYLSYIVYWRCTSAICINIFYHSRNLQTFFTVINMPGGGDGDISLVRKALVLYVTLFQLAISILYTF
jgi:hypothetical protein